MAWRLVNVKFMLQLHPQYVGRIQGGIDHRLDSMLMKYNPVLNGVVVSTSDVKLLSENGRIINNSPYIHFGIQCNMVVFAPRPGSRLVGVVSKVGADHISLLVHGLFNASIGADLIRSEFEYAPDDMTDTGDCEEVWTSNRMPYARIAEGSRVSFCVERLTAARDIVSVVGSLIPDDTGPLVDEKLPWNPIVPDPTATTPSDDATPATMAIIDGESAMAPETPAVNPPDPTAPVSGVTDIETDSTLKRRKHKKKKDKKRRRESEGLARELFEAGEETPSKTKAKRKKAKKEKKEKEK